MAILKIYSPIVDEDERTMLELWGMDGVSYASVDEFVENIAEGDNVIDIRLHCPGGAVAEGWAIVDRLRATGKEIRATIEGTCASMASVILLAASVRRGAPHATLLIHDPFIPEYTLADSYSAEELQRIAGDLAAERERILDFYVERTGSDREVLDAQMRAGTEMDMERAKELGFIQEMVAPLSARAGKWNRKSNQHKFSDMELLDKLVAAVTSVIKGDNGGNPKAVNYDLNTAEGDVITIDKPEGEDPAVGDKASPDGEHLMPDGSTIVIQDGEITEIRPAEEENPENPEETEALKGRIAELEARVTELEGELAKAQSLAKTKDEMRVLNLVAIAGGERWLSSAKSNYRPAARDEGNGGAGVSAFTEQIAEARRRNGIGERK